MFDKRTHYSYRAQKNKRSKVIIFIIGFVVLYILYNCLTAFFFSVWVVDNNTMQPGLSAGDRIIFNSFKPPSFIRSNNDNHILLKRGSVVLVDMRHEKNLKLPLRILDGAVRFFTAQRISIFSGRGQYYIKRVIALPGDEISMSNYMFRVKAAGTSFSLTEYELAAKPYHPAIPKTPGLWDDSLPFSGNMDPVILGPDECFVVSDDRSNSNDSRTWGAISPSLIKAKAAVRIWPLNKLELF
ncbi:MAG: signal peptidase I [Treponema sp.]|nr:signal peptidase I [Treponema sp.]